MGARKYLRLSNWNGKIAGCMHKMSNRVKKLIFLKLELDHGLRRFLVSAIPCMHETKNQRHILPYLVLVVD